MLIICEGLVYAWVCVCVCACACVCARVCVCVCEDFSDYRKKASQHV